jgi:anoctamin-10
MALIPPAFIGVVSAYMKSSGGLSEVTIIFFCIFNLVWATIFLEVWKRNCATWTYKWGSIRTERYEEARPQYYGVLSHNKVTGRLEPKYPKWKRTLKFYGGSLPVVFLCLLVAFYIMLVNFWSEDLAMAYHKQHESTFSSIMLYMPTIVYAIVIVIMNAVYRKIAKILNDWGE